MNKKTKKRLIATLTAAGILVLSATFGNTPAKETVDNTSEEQYNLALNKLLNRDVSGKKIVQDGDSSNVIQKITVTGTIDAPMTNEENLYSVISQIYTAKNDPNVKAILLSVNTPGGGVYESAEIYKALKESGKDVYVSMKKQATSGGYYISMAAKTIYAHEETTTGSLGVVMSNLSLQKYLEDKGIKNQVIRSGEQKAVGGLTEDLPESTIEIYKEINRESYNKFVDLIVEGRNLPREEVLKLADGRVYSGTQAVNNKLVDKIGTEKELIEAIRSEKNIKDAQVVEYYEAKAGNSILSNLVSSLAKSLASELNNAVTSREVERNYLG